jgi:hypothetical protein
MAQTGEGGGGGSGGGGEDERSSSKVSPQPQSVKAVLEKLRYKAIDS